MKSVGTSVNEKIADISGDKMDALQDSPSIACPGFDNPLLQHIANMNNPGCWNNASSTMPTKYNATCAPRQNYVLSDSNDENNISNMLSKDGDHPSSMFDDPLYQHMAMMNGLG